MRTLPHRLQRFAASPVGCAAGPPPAREGASLREPSERRFLKILSALFLALLFSLPAAARADDTFDLTPAIPVQVIEVPPEAQMTVIAAHGAAAAAARDLAEGMQADRAELEKLLGGLDAGDIEVRLAFGREEFAALQPRGRRAPGWAAGVAWPHLGLVVVDVRASNRGGDVRAVLRHELAHVALGRLIQGQVPRWFTEGFAQLYAGEWTLSRSATLARAVSFDALIPVQDIERSWPRLPTDVDLAYAQSVSLVSHLATRGDRGGLQRLIYRLGQGEEFHQAFSGAMSQPLVVVELEWKEVLRDRYGWLPVITDTNLVLGLGGFILTIGAWRARRRRKRRMAAMEDGPHLDVEQDGSDEAETTGGPTPGAPAPVVAAPPPVPTPIDLFAFRIEPPVPVAGPEDEDEEEEDLRADRPRGSR